MQILYWLLCFLIGLLPAWLVYRNDRKKNIPVKWFPAVLRFVTCFLTAALLLAPAIPSTQTDEEKPVLIWLQDNSSSMIHSLGKDSTVYRQKMNALWNTWEKDYKLVTMSFGAGVQRDSLFNFKQRSTNIANAIQSATEQYSDRNLGAIVLASDGIYNEGLDPEYAHSENNIPVFALAIGDSTQPKDIRIARVYANKTVAFNSSFEVIVDINAEKLSGTTAHLSLQHLGRALNESNINIGNDRFTTSVKFEVKATDKGFQKYSLLIPALDGEQNVTNNRIDFFVEVIDEETKVLIVAAAPHPDIAAIREALESVPQYKVDIHFGADIPKDIKAYNVVVAHQMPVAGTLQAAGSEIPVWYILGKQSNLALFNQQQTLINIAGNGQGNDVLPLLNANFNAFSLMPNIKEVMTKMPPLESPYGQYKVDGKAQILMQQKIGNITTNYPLWIFDNATIPKAVLCGEGLWRWRLYEYKNFGKHEVVDELIRQTVRLLSVKKDERPFRVFMDKNVLSDNEPVNIQAELKNENAELVNTPDVKLTVLDSSGKALNYTFDKGGNAYHLNIGLLAPGNYTYKGQVGYNGKNYTAEGSFIIESVPLEQLRANADYQLMNKLAHQSGGSFFTMANMDKITDSLKNNASVKPIIHSDKTYSELINRKWLFFLILIFVTGEWLIRKYWNV